MSNQETIERHFVLCQKLQEDQYTRQSRIVSDSFSCQEDQQQDQEKDNEEEPAPQLLRQK